MKIAYCGPVSLRLLCDLVEESDSLPEGYGYPLGAYLVRSYISAGHDVCVVTSSNYAEDSPDFWRGNRLVIINTQRRRYMRYVLDAYAHERRQMVSALKEFRPDVIHAQWTYEFAHAAATTGFPFVATLRDSPWTIAAITKSWYRVYRALYAKHVIGQINHLSAISNYVAEKVKTHYSYPRAIRIIPNGLTPDLIADSPKLPSNTDAIRFASVSGWDPRKNVKILLRAFSEFRTQMPAARLSLIGGGLGKGEDGETWALSKGIAGNVDFLGRLDHASVIQYLRTSADIFVHSTIEESFCMTVLEAMAQGLPVVALPESGAVPWLLDFGAAGKLASSQDADSLKEALLEIASNIQERDLLSKRALVRAGKEFSLDKVAAEYLEFFSSIISQRENIS